MSNLPAGAEWDSDAPYNMEDFVPQEYEIYLKQIKDLPHQHPDYVSIIGEDYNFRVVTVWNGYSVHVDEYDDMLVSDHLERRDGFYHNITQKEFREQLDEVLNKIDIL